MSAEIKATINVQVTNGIYKDSFNSGSLTYDQSIAAGGNPGVVTVSHTAEQDIAFGSITPGIIVIQNLDLTNFVKFGPKSAGVMVLMGKISPGKCAFFELGASVTLRMVADTGDCNVQIKGQST